MTHRPIHITPKPDPHTSAGTQDATWRQRLADIEDLQSLVAAGTIHLTDNQAAAVKAAEAEARSSIGKARRRPQPWF